MLLAVTLIAGVSLAAVLVAAGRVVETTRSSDRLTICVAATPRSIGSSTARARFGRGADAAHRRAAGLSRAHRPSSPIAGDAATISAMAEDYRGKLGADFCIVTDARGRWIGSPEGEGPCPGCRPPPRSTQRAAGNPRHDIVPLEQSLYLVVSEPAMFADEVLGTITAGYKLDDRVVAELSLVTHCEVNLVCADDRLCGSSLPSAQRADLTSVLTADRRSSARSAIRPRAAQDRPRALRQRRLPAAAGPRQRGAGAAAGLGADRAGDRSDAALLMWVGVVTLGVALGGSLIVEPAAHASAAHARGRRQRDRRRQLDPPGAGRRHRRRRG